MDKETEKVIDIIALVTTAILVLGFNWAFNDLPGWQTFYISVLIGYVNGVAWTLYKRTYDLADLLRESSRR